MVLAAVLMAIPAAAMAQGVSGTQRMNGSEPKPSVTSQNPNMSHPGEYTTGLTNEQLLPLSVHEAWVQSGRNEDRFFDMVKQLAELSARSADSLYPRTKPQVRKRATGSRRKPEKILTSCSTWLSIAL
jgi:hypothetical protein